MNMLLQNKNKPACGCSYVTFENYKNRHMKKIFFLFGITIVLLLFFNSCNILQSGKLNEVQLNEEFIDGDIFIESIDFYQRFLYENPNDADFNYKMGFALLNTKGQIGRASCRERV